MAVPAVCGVAIAEIAKWSSAPGLTSKVWVPVAVPRVTVKVLPLPAVRGVTLTLFNTPDAKLADVPVMPAVPPNVTVLMKLVKVVLLALLAVMVIPVIAVPAVCGDEIAVMSK